MTSEEYRRKRAHLVEVLADAVERGDWGLEMDMKDAIYELDTTYEQED